MSSSAVNPLSTVKGSIGVCRKRDFFFIRDNYMGGSRSLERAADPQIRGTGGLARRAVAAPRRAGGDREAQRVAGDDVRRQFGADCRLDIVELETARPGVPDVAEDRGVNSVEEPRPGPEAALWRCERPAVFGVHERHAPPDKGICLEGAQQAEGVRIEVED